MIITEEIPTLVTEGARLMNEKMKTAWSAARRTAVRAGSLAAAAACGTACGAGDKQPQEQPAACGTACGAGDK